MSSSSDSSSDSSRSNSPIAASRNELPMPGITSRTPENEEVTRLKLLNKYLTKDLAKVKKQLETLQIESKKKYQELEREKVEEAKLHNEKMVDLLSIIVELELLQFREKEKNRELTKQVNEWKEKSKKCYEYEEEVKKLKEKLPTCQICRFRFGESPERTPRVLECGHSVCEECAGHLATPYADPDYDFQIFIKIKCPFDRKETIVADDVNNLPKNFTAIENVSGDT